MNTVTILLAAYNGQKYIDEMIDSIISQDFTDWKLILSDDCSTDGTPEILQSYAAKMPEKIIHYKSGQRFGNAQNHFMHLLNRFHDSPYVMFCDQDDVWHPDKISKTLEKMHQTEKDAAIPTLVHTDLCVVDGSLKKISDSFCKHSKLSGNRLKLNNLLVQNVVTGCTLMINKKLAEISCSRPFPKEAAMHDWWIALICSVFGSSAFLDHPTIDYRQHGDNSVGAKNVTSPKYLFEKLKVGAMKKSLKNSTLQAEAFLECFGEEMPAEKREVVLAFSKTSNMSFLNKNLVYLKYRLYKHGLLRILAQFFGG